MNQDEAQSAEKIDVQSRNLFKFERKILRVEMVFDHIRFSLVSAIIVVIS
ncbi:Hypothetical protein MCB1EB_1977 [Mycoavidus cysteinexigens]|uniref:Uncharacterized protein n=1 Tax=Mycoavidus cysteinexigens TaxID=1553431 RepID=A0A2Z6EXP2_9BURK|nr:Hypothetical protein MCB1EB_1977 [Mycoavidus cysteinexigens]GLR00555.1 hypothetical protein GCM10007934_03660 [Mycoavidus cysteinexigens]